MTRASFVLLALSSLVLPSCSSVSLGGSRNESDAGGSSTSTSGSSPMGGSGGNGGGGAFDAAAPGGQDGGGASGTEPCQGLEIPDFDCSTGTPTYICVKGENGWAWDYTCPPQVAAEAGVPYPIDAPVERTCTYKGKTYPYGASWQDECNTCWCNPVAEGGLMCTAKGCSVDAGPAQPDTTRDAGFQFCLDPNPATRTCRNSDAECIPSSCTCRGSNGTWGCTADCRSLPICQQDGMDAGSSTVCDSAKAAQALSAAGVITVGAGMSFIETLPSDLSSGPNWGVKDFECREGGYDLSPFAGQSVCLVSFATQGLCEQLPAKAWVVMSEGTVRCIYKSAASTPGIYSVHDSSCTSPDAGTTNCPSPNPADRTCENWTSECVPSSCSCGSNGSWNCTTDCRGLPACNAFWVSEGACQGKSIENAQGVRIDNTQAAAAFGRYMQSISVPQNPLPKVEAAEQTVTNLWDVMEAQLFFAKIYAQDGSLWREVAFVHRHCGLTLLTTDRMLGLIQSGVVANGVFYYSWAWGSGLPRTNIGSLYYAFETPTKSISADYLNQTLVVGVEGTNPVAYRASIGAKFNEWKDPVRVGSIQYIGEGLVLVDGTGKEINP